MGISRRRAAGIVWGALCAAASLLSSPLSAQDLRYTVRFPAPQTSYAEVEASFATGGADAVTVMMPVWTPGSYLVREYARNVEALAAAAPTGSRWPSPRRARTAGR
jgi:hypothetical protein